MQFLPLSTKQKKAERVLEELSSKVTVTVES